MLIAERYKNILSWFETHMPVAESELVFASPYQCLVAVMLSAQCTDKRVNMVTPSLFEAYPTPEDLAKATSDEVFEYVKSVSYPRSKAEHLVAMAKRLVEVYDGVVPDNIEDLQTLQGVGRKTANVVCAVIWNQPTMAVDTHIFRDGESTGKIYSPGRHSQGAPLASPSRPLCMPSAQAAMRTMRITRIL